MTGLRLDNRWRSEAPRRSIKDFDRERGQDGGLLQNGTVHIGQEDTHKPLQSSHNFTVDFENSR